MESHPNGLPRISASVDRVTLNLSKLLITRESDSWDKFMSSHLLLLIVKPISLHCKQRDSKSSVTNLLSPPRMPSSRYHKLSSDDSKLTMGLIVRQKRRGPRGSPCCIPEADVTTL